MPNHSLVFECMSRSVVFVSGETHVDEAHALLRDHAFKHLLVEDEGKLVGVLCACDLELAPRRERVLEIMASPPIVILPNARADQAAALMNEAGIGCLPVVSDGKVVGILTRSDLRSASMDVA